MAPSWRRPAARVSTRIWRCRTPCSGASTWCSCTSCWCCGGCAKGKDRALAQGLFDAFCRDMDHNLREMGISDQGVPKHMQRVGEAFYGRAQAYEAALGAPGEGALSDALARNVYAGMAEPQMRRDGACSLCAAGGGASRRTAACCARSRRRCGFLNSCTRRRSDAMAEQTSERPWSVLVQLARDLGERQARRRSRRTPRCVRRSPSPPGWTPWSG